jgi:hypothetical protein
MIVVLGERHVVRVAVAQGARGREWENQLQLMNPLLFLALLFGTTNLQDAGEPFRLDAGEFRWIPIRIRQTPVQVDCRFHVVRGNSTVHMELLPLSEFRRYDRGQEHDTLASTPDGREGEFRRIVDTPGQYRVLVQNKPGAAPVSVVLEVATNLDPQSGVAQTLPPGRRLTVILASFAFFFAALAWSGHKLLRNIRRT